MFLRLRTALVLALALLAALPAPAFADGGTRPTPPPKPYSEFTWVHKGVAGGNPNAISPNGVFADPTPICFGRSDNPHMSSHEPGNVTAQGTTGCNVTMSSITASSVLYKEFAWIFWVEIARDPQTKTLDTYVESHPGVSCPGSLNYKIETHSEAYTICGDYGYTNTSATAYVSCP